MEHNLKKIIFLVYVNIFKKKIKINNFNFNQKIYNKNQFDSLKLLMFITKVENQIKKNYKKKINLFELDFGKDTATFDTLIKKIQKKIK